MQVPAFLKKQSQGKELVLPFLDSPKMWESASPTAPSMKNLYQNTTLLPLLHLGDKKVTITQEKREIQ